MSLNEQEIRKQAKEIIDAAAKEIINEPWERDYGMFCEEGKEVRFVYLGTVFSVMPSGKYYMPWASSNVANCNHCEGEGCDYCGGLGSREAYEDEIMTEALEEYAYEYGLFLTNGEGCSTDILVGESKLIESGKN